jgi:deoxycytidine triphosphate deaminase
MFHSGEYVAEHVREFDGSKVPEENIETHGVELGIDTIYRVEGPSFISNDGYSKPERIEMKTRSTDQLDLPNGSIEDEAEADVIQSEHYTLNEGNYVIVYDKEIHIPNDTVAFVFPRSRLMRSGLQLTTAVWESGYSGIGEGGLYVDNQAFVKDDTNVGQIVMARASVMEKYDGSHQGENLDNIQE